jgi:hypothetical protein
LFVELIWTVVFPDAADFSSGKFGAKLVYADEFGLTSAPFTKTFELASKFVPCKINL